MPMVRTNSGRAYGHVTTKMSQMGRLRDFLTYRATLERAMRALGAPLEPSIMRFDLLETTRSVRNVLDMWNVLKQLCLCGQFVLAIIRNGDTTSTFLCYATTTPQLTIYVALGRTPSHRP